MNDDDDDDDDDDEVTKQAARGSEWRYDAQLA